MLKVCGGLKELIPYRGLILPQSRKSAEVRAQPYSSGAHRPCSARAITHCFLWRRLSCHASSRRPEISRL